MEDVTFSFLTDAVFTLETIQFAAYMDILRAPQHRQLFDGISDFKEKLDDAAKFFQDLAEEGSQRFVEMENNPVGNFTEDRVYKDLAMQEGIALFCLKGEIQKLGNAHLDTRQKTAFSATCSKIDEAIKMSRSLDNKAEKNKVVELLYEAYDELIKAAEKLAPYGGAIQYLAEKVKKPAASAECAARYRSSPPPAHPV